MRYLIALLFLAGFSAQAQEDIYPNKYSTDRGLLEYRPYTLEEARTLEKGEGRAPRANPFLLDWGPERRLTEQTNVYFERALSAQDTILVSYGLIWGQQANFIYSLNGGQTWEPYVSLNDTAHQYYYLFPEIVKDGNNLSIGFALGQSQFGYSIGYFNSSNRGQTWTGLNRVFPYQSTEILQYASFSNWGRNIYASYVNVEYDSIYVLKSTNWGTSWNGRGVNVAYLNGTPQPMTIRASGGNIHLVWVNEEGTINVRYSRSTNGGVNWSPQIDIAADSFGAQQPYLAVQDSHVVVSWMGYKYSPYMFNGDLFIRQSFDNGASWDSAQVLTDLHRVWMGSVYTKDSLIVATWQDDRYRDQNYNSEVYARFSTDYGASWTQEERISFGDDDSDSPIATTTGNTIHIIWGDRRPQASGLYYRMYDPNYDAIKEIPDIPDKPAILSAYPNPFNSSVIISYSNNKDKTSELTIYNIMGEKIRTLKIDGKEGKAVWDGKDDNNNPVSSGVYFAKISASGKDISVKLVLLK